MERAVALEAFRDAFARQLDVAPERIVEDARLKQDLDADSLDVVEVLMLLEDRFNVLMPAEDLEGATTVGDVVTSVLEMMASQA